MSAIRAVRGCPTTLTENPKPHGPHTWTFRSRRVECDGHWPEEGGVSCTCFEPTGPSETERRMARAMGATPEYVHAVMDLFTDTFDQVAEERGQ
jgi:hypothetical protein